VAGSKTFVGFGFGPIQSGLFLFEAYKSGNFSRFVVSEVDKELVRAVRENRRRYAISVARFDRIDRYELEGIEVYDPGDPVDRERIVSAVACSDEMATSLPSVRFYDMGDETSVARILAEGLSRRRSSIPTAIYAAENHNQAAEFLRRHLEKYAAPAVLEKVQVLNTVIGKMSGVITDPAVIEKLDLVTVTPGISRAVLVEEFNRILISRITLEGYRRGIEVFQEKEDLLPFEEAKLYGHNAIHALIAYLGDLEGLETMAQAGRNERIMRIARDAFVNESGAALIKRHAKLGDPLFTPEGYREYAEDLLKRMVCPNLNDLISRVGRDHVRKLGFDDRLYGTMRIVLEQGIEPTNLALGAAGGVLSMIKRRDSLGQPVAHLPEEASGLTREVLGELLLGLWQRGRDRECDRLIDLTWRALQMLRG